MRTLGLVSFVLIAASAVFSPSRGEEPFRVTLLGTGNPVPIPDRFGPATLIEAGDQKLVFDVGRGATIRLFQLGIPLNRVATVFLTHFHSDHTVGGAVASCVGNADDASGSV
jgi:ribonuclease BN (tRNA processing enzyme)